MQTRTFRGKILIVTEDTKSSLGYFEEIRVEYRLPEESVRVVPGIGSDPVSVVRTAAERLRTEERADARRVDRVFVVIDRDTHVAFDAAMTLLTQFNGAASGGGTRNVSSWTPPDGVPDRLRFELILSDPCFELWLLLHFTPWNAEVTAGGGRSVCGSVIHQLRQPDRLPDYDKGDSGWWGRTKPLYETAGKPNAQTATETSKQAGRTNPSTTVHKVVDAIVQLGRPS